MITELQIPENIFEQIVVQAGEQSPIEACGILAGKNSIAEKLYKMTNVDKSHDHFMMEPEEQFAVMKDMRAAGMDMLAVYHSHPTTPARPSQEDIRMAFTPGVVYVIVSLLTTTKPEVKAFNIENSNVTEISVEIVKRQK